MKRILKTLLLFYSTVLFASPAVPIPTNSVTKAVVDGKNLTDYTDTGMVVRRTIVPSDGSIPTPLYIPILIRKDTLFLQPAAADKLLALRPRLAEYMKKAVELEELGTGIQSDYDAIVASTRPHTQGEK